MTERFLTALVIAGSACTLFTACSSDDDGDPASAQSNARGQKTPGSRKTDAAAPPEQNTPDSALDAAMPEDAAAEPQADGVELLVYLDWSGRVLSLHADGTEDRVLLGTDRQAPGPDGVAVDADAGHVYWTNMGGPTADDGFIQRAELDGSNLTTIVPVGGTFTPKQLKLDAESGKLYWSDREGMRVMRANLDGSDVETLVITGSGDADRSDAAHWCVGMALDPRRREFYWTQKGPDNGGVGTIKRASFDIPAGQDASDRSDVEILFENLPEPIDLEIDPRTDMLYWTDRGDDTINRAGLDVPAGETAASRSDREVLVRGVSEAIGVALDLEGDRMFYTSLTQGSIGTARLDGSAARTLVSSKGALTGIAYVESAR